MAKTTEKTSLDTEVQAHHHDQTVSIAVADPNVPADLCSLLLAVPLVRSVRTFSDESEAFRALFKGECDALMINLFAFDMKVAIDLIAATRERVPHVPICLMGTIRQLAVLADVPDNWRERFTHYYKFPLDLSLHQLEAQARQTAKLLTFYLVSRKAQVRLRDLRNMLGSHRAFAIDGLRGQKQSIDETFDLAEKALSARQDALKPSVLIVPGFEGQALQDLVKDTLEKASKSLDITATVNKAILIFGALLLAGSFIAAVSMRSWEAVSFGGFGIAGIVASLVVNPLKSISLGSRRLVQIQVAYLGFLNQLALLNNNSEDLASADIAARSSALKEATNSLLDALAKHFQ